MARRAGPCVTKDDCGANAEAPDAASAARAATAARMVNVSVLSEAVAIALYELGGSPVTWMRLMMMRLR